MKESAERMTELNSTGVLVSFETVPLGSRIKYPGSDRVWTVLRKWRMRDGERLHGLLAEWQPNMDSFGKWPGQSLVSHIPNECPEEVYFLN